MGHAMHSLRLPLAFRKHLGTVQSKTDVYQQLRKSKLHTVCEEARCPNIGECFSKKTATWMILGDRCTRRCHFCAVQTKKPLPVDAQEPERLVEAIQALGLDYVVITSVDRDDLKDCGAMHFAHCIKAIKKHLPHVRIELLTPDFKGKLELVDQVVAAGPTVFGHNTETVSRLYQKLRPQSRFETSQKVLAHVAKNHPCQVKTGLMVGLGETDEEVLETLEQIKTIGVHRVSIGQYLRPSLKHWPVARYVGEESYALYAQKAKMLGFVSFVAGPFVRSSYHAKEAYTG